MLIFFELHMFLVHCSKLTSPQNFTSKISKNMPGKGGAKSTYVKHTPPLKIPDTNFFWWCLIIFCILHNILTLT